MLCVISWPLEIFKYFYQTTSKSILIISCCTVCVFWDTAYRQSYRWLWRWQYSRPFPPRSRRRTRKRRRPCEYSSECWASSGRILPGRSWRGVIRPPGASPSWTGRSGMVFRERDTPASRSGEDGTLGLSAAPGMLADLHRSTVTVTVTCWLPCFGFFGSLQLLFYYRFK